MTIRETLALVDVAPWPRPVIHAWLEPEDYREGVTDWAQEMRVRSPDEPPNLPMKIGAVVLHVRSPRTRRAVLTASPSESKGDNAALGLEGEK